jgi:hypothetical protein
MSFGLLVKLLYCWETETSVLLNRKSALVAMRSLHLHWQLYSSGAYDKQEYCNAKVYFIFGGNLNKFIFKIYSKSVRMVVRNIWPQP